MKSILFVAVIVVFSYLLCGCKSIDVGGKGEIGGVKGRGSISIPLPKK